jgi:hypothetical protein
MGLLEIWYLQKPGLGGATRLLFGASPLRPNRRERLRVRGVQHIESQTDPIPQAVENADERTPPGPRIGASNHPNRVFTVSQLNPVQNESIGDMADSCLEPFAISQ